MAIDLYNTMYFASSSPTEALSLSLHTEPIKLVMGLVDPMQIQAKEILAHILSLLLSPQPWRGVISTEINNEGCL